MTCLWSSATKTFPSASTEMSLGKPNSPSADPKRPHAPRNLRSLSNRWTRKLPVSATQKPPSGAKAIAPAFSPLTLNLN